MLHAGWNSHRIVFFSKIDVISVEASGGDADEKMSGMLDESKGEF